MKIRLLLILFWLPLWFQAQTDTTEASKNVRVSILSFDGDGKINLEKVKDIGEGIPHLTIFNLAYNNVTIRLTIDGQVWSYFTLDAISKNNYRCDGIQNMYIEIEPTTANPIKAKITRNKKYKIFYDHQLQIYDIGEM